MSEVGRPRPQAIEGTGKTACVDVEGMVTHAFSAQEAIVEMAGTSIATPSSWHRTAGTA